MRLADLSPGDVVEHASTGFTWVVLRIEPITRCFQWAPMASRWELTQVQIKPRWSPPHSVERWNAEIDATVRRNRR